MNRAHYRLQIANKERSACLSKTYEWYDDAVFVFLSIYPEGTIGQEDGICFGGSEDKCWASADTNGLPIGTITKVMF